MIHEGWPIVPKKHSAMWWSTTINVSATFKLSKYSIRGLVGELMTLPTCWGVSGLTLPIDLSTCWEVSESLKHSYRVVNAATNINMQRAENTCPIVPAIAVRVKRIQIATSRQITALPQRTDADEHLAAIEVAYILPSISFLWDDRTWVSLRTIYHLLVQSRWRPHI